MPVTGGVNLMPALTSASILSANPKRGEAGGERTEEGIKRLIHERAVNTVTLRL